MVYKKIGFVADTVLIDPEYWLISKNNISKKIADSIPGQNIIQVFPNPVQKQLLIYLKNFTESNAAITIYNDAGQILYQQRATLSNNSFFQEINTEGYASGAYFVKVQSGNTTIAVKKIVK